MREERAKRGKKEEKGGRRRPGFSRALILFMARLGTAPGAQDTDVPSRSSHSVSTRTDRLPKEAVVAGRVGVPAEQHSTPPSTASEGFGVDAQM